MCISDSLWSVHSLVSLGPQICATRRESHAKNKTTVNAKARAYYQQHREVKQSYYQRNKATILAKAAARRRR